MGLGAIQIVMGPAGSGKSTYCSVLQDHCATLGGSRKRTVHVGNLDPAAEHFRYDVTFDIRTELISVEEVMGELGLGPNGALMYCMEYLLQNLDWLQDHLESFVDDEYLILDCPGQIELYTHVPIMKTIVDKLQYWGYNNSMVSVFCIDASFCCDISKFLSGSLLALSSMIAIELPHVNVLTKCDLLPESDVDAILEYTSAIQLYDTDRHNKQTLQSLQQQQQQFQKVRNSNSTTINNVNDDDGLDELYNQQQNILQQQQQQKNDNNDEQDNDSDKHNDKEQQQQEEEEDRQRQRMIQQRRRQRERLTENICNVLDDYTMVSYCPLNINDEDSIDHVLNIVDHTIQYGEDLEVRGAEADDDNYGNDGDDDNNE